MRGAVAIPLDVALARFPSLASTVPAPDMSARYSHISTADVLSGLTKEGFEIFSVQTARALTPEKRPFSKHLVRLRKPGARSIGDSVPEICVLNAHNGRSAYKAFSGVFRFLCENGLIVGDVFGTYKIRHSGDIVGKVIDATYSIVSQFDSVADNVEAMRARVMTYDERHDLATRALAVRFPNDSAPASFNAAELLYTRRAEDAGADLWSTFNRVQENLTQGGLTGFRTNSRGRVGRSTMRRLSAIDGNTRVNRGLWDVAASYLPSNPAPLLIAA
ncbi:MAG: DUF932 domain-containing protein [Burkholderiaceae bacterium]